MSSPDKTITIVSGLPRSGTSMMMQMLEAGGLTPLTDNLRKPDDDNPKGYYEFEPVKRVKQDASWLASAEGKVVKMVYMLLYDLPEDRSYRVVFMERNLAEVVASQNRMLDRLGRSHGNLSDAEVILTFRRHLDKIKAWLAARPNFHTLYARYNEIITNPEPLIEKINRFMDNGLDAAGMKRCIDSSLYRQRV